ncbi:helix-turn-helix transcriptional regulator [Streptomyces shenzhenensis]|uniref:helix-turn-helix transcriptional regulator n=1 Tax=Streptomyces shenzhenensis TaxID=943815 RepID=UPI003D93E3FA
MGVPVRYMFTLEIENFDMRDEATVERFYEDAEEAYLSARDGLVDATYVIEADEDDPCDAVLDAANHLRSLIPEARVTQVAIDLVSVSDIAARVGKPRATIRSWVKGSRGPGHFPRPLSTLGGGVQVWHWPEVNEWLRLHHPEAADDERGLPMKQIHRINHALSSAKFQTPQVGQSVAEIAGWRTARQACLSVDKKSQLSLPDHPYESRVIR